MQFNNLKRTASGLVRFDQKSSETQVQTKKERMEEAIRLLNDKERNLARQYFSTIDRNKDGVLSKLELQVTPHYSLVTRLSALFLKSSCPGLHCQQTRLPR